MSSKKTKLGSSRRYKNRNKETEERENDEGFQDPEKEQYQNEISTFSTVSQNQSSNDSLLPQSDQPVKAGTKPNTSVLELSSQPQSQHFTDLLGQAEVTSKHRKMGSNRNSRRNFKFEGIYEDEPEDRVQLCEGICDEQRLSENASVKEDEGQNVHKCLLDCAPSQSEQGSSILHSALDTTVQNEDHNNEENQHLEAALQSKHIDIYASKLQISSKNSDVTQPKFNVSLKELNESFKIHQTDKPVASLPNIPGQASQIDMTHIPFNDSIYNDKSSLLEHIVLKTTDTQSSLNIINGNTQEDTKMLNSLSTEDIRQDKVLSASLTNEHKKGTTVHKVASVIWENVGTKANTEYGQCIEHKDKELTVQLTDESIRMYESTEFGKDDKCEKLCVAVNRTDSDLAKVTATNRNPAMELETNIMSHLKLEKETSEQVLTYKLEFQGDSEINCYRKEKKDLPGATCLMDNGNEDEEIIYKEGVMHYDKEQICRPIATEKQAENNDMQSANFIAESQLILDETMDKKTEAKTKTCKLQHNSEEFRTELEPGDQILDKAIKDTSESQDIETEEDINAGSTESFTIKDLTDVDDDKVDMTTFIDELQIASTVYIQKSPAENVDLGLSEKNNTDSTISGLNLGCNQKVIKEIIQTQSFNETSTSEDVSHCFTFEICSTQSTESINMMEPVAEKNKENGIKALVTNEKTSTLQGQHEAELVNTNQKCSVLGKQNEETLMVENIDAVLNITYVVENLKMQGETELSDTVVRNEDLNSEHSKSLKYSGTINSDQPIITSAENTMVSELSTQTFSAPQTASKHLSLAAEHPDFKEDDGKSKENVQRSHQPIAEKEEREDQEMKWKNLENTETLKHQIITQSSTSNFLNLDKQVTRPGNTENECANKVNVYPTCSPFELIPEKQVTFDMQKNTENFHAVVSDLNQYITEEHLENVTNKESEANQLAGTSTYIQIAELKSSQVDLMKGHVEISSSNKRRNTDLTQKSLKGQIPSSDQQNKFKVIKDNENVQEQIMDQNSTMIKEDTNDIKEEINADLTENFTKKDITAVHSQNVLCDLSSQNTNHCLTTIKQPSPASEHPDFRKYDGNSKKNVDNKSEDIHQQIQAKEKKKFGSTHRPHGKHQLTSESEEDMIDRRKDMENTEENKHQIVTTPSKIYTEPKITMSEMTPDSQNSSLTITKQQQNITTEVETGTGITSSLRISSCEIAQSHKLVFNAPSITKIQDDAFNKHVKMQSDKSSENKCVSEYNLHFTYENLENQRAEIHTQTQTKKRKKFGSTRRLNTETRHARHETPVGVADGEWMDLENTEKTKSIDESRFDMPVVLEQYHTKTEELLEEPKNTESKLDHFEIACAVVHTQELNIAQGNLVTKNSGDNNKITKIGLTRENLGVMEEKENIQEKSTEESTPNSEKYSAKKEPLNSNTKISHQSIQMHFETLNLKDEAEKRCFTCENLGVKPNKVEAWQKTPDLAEENNFECLQLVSKEDILSPESNICPTSSISRQEKEPHIHHKHDQSENLCHTEIKLYPDKILEGMENITTVNPDILEMSESMSELPSSQNPQSHIESSSQARRRKMGSSRRMSKNKNEKVKIDELTIDARTVNDTVMVELREDMEECAELSQTNQSSAQDTEQLSESRQKFGSRYTTKKSSGTIANIDSEFKRKKDIQVNSKGYTTEGELKVSETGYISEPVITLISPAVSEPRPEIKEVIKTVAPNTSTKGSIVSLDSIRKTMPSAVTTGEMFDFEQLNELVPDFEKAVYNVVMVGNSNVGKTSFIKRLQSGSFTQDYSATIGVDTFVHTVTFGSRTVKLYVWDTAGQERYHSITRQVFHKAHGLLLMYDITSSQSFHAVRDWISQVQENAAPDVILMLLGNKNDCSHREVLLQDGENLSNEYNIQFMECSAATGENLLESLKTLAWLLVKQRVRKEDKYTTLQPQNKKTGCC